MKNDDQSGDFRSLVRQIQQSDGDRDTGAPNGGPRMGGRRTLIVREFDRPTRRPAAPGAAVSGTAGPVTPESGFRASRPTSDAEGRPAPRTDMHPAPRPGVNQSTVGGATRPAAPAQNRETQPGPRRSAVSTVFGVPGRGPFLLSQRWL